MHTRLLIAWIVSLLHWQSIVLAGNEVVLSTCIHELHLLNDKVIGYPWDIKLLFCRCDCDQDTASKLYFQAYYNFRIDCDTSFKELSGICFSKTQDEMEYSNSCYQDGYAHCLFKITANQTYNALYLRDDETSYIRITINSNISFNLPMDAKRFIWSDVLYKIYDNCSPNHYSPGVYYVKKRDSAELWKEREEGITFPKKNLVEISDSLKLAYEQNTELTDTVCSRDYGPGSFMFTAAEPGSNEEIGEKLPINRVVVMPEKVEIHDKTLSVGSVDVTSTKYFFFSGSIKYGSDGMQYLVINNCSHGEKILRGSINNYKLEILPEKKYAVLEDTNYGRDQVVGLYPETEVMLKTFAMVNFTEEVIVIPTTTTPVPLKVNSTPTTTPTLVTTLTPGNFNANAQLSTGVIIVIIVIILFVCLVIILPVVILHPKIRCKKNLNYVNSSAECGLRNERNQTHGRIFSTMSYLCCREQEEQESHQLPLVNRPSNPINGRPSNHHQSENTEPTLPTNNIDDTGDERRRLMTEIEDPREDTRRDLTEDNRRNPIEDSRQSINIDQLPTQVINVIMQPRFSVDVRLDSSNCNNRINSNEINMADNCTVTDAHQQNTNKC